jgi:SAM-dependent methyltransferase
MKSTEGKTFDPIGFETLDVIGKANRFNHWMFSIIEPYCSGQILEIGSGIGNISAFFISGNANIYLSDINPEYCRFLARKFPLPKSKIISIDLLDADFDVKFQHLFNSFDTIFALNVLEHIPDHDQALQNAFKLLKYSGRLIILVPANPFLYCRFDKELGHCRRYSKKLLRNTILQNNFQVEKLFRFNLVGIGAWFLFGKLFGRKQIEGGEMGLFNKLVPIFKLMDKITFRIIGLSLIVIATKPNQ